MNTKTIFAFRVNIFGQVVLRIGCLNQEEYREGWYIWRDATTEEALLFFKNHTK